MDEPELSEVETRMGDSNACCIFFVHNPYCMKRENQQYTLATGLSANETGEVRRHVEVCFLLYICATVNTLLCVTVNICD